jgi:hypothetical protein
MKDEQVHFRKSVGYGLKNVFQLIKFRKKIENFRWMRNIVCAIHTECLLWSNCKSDLYTYCTNSIVIQSDTEKGS